MKKLKPIPQRKNIDKAHRYSKDTPPSDLLHKFMNRDPSVPQWYIDQQHPIYVEPPYRQTTYPPQSEQSRKRQNSRRISTI